LLSTLFDLPGRSEKKERRIEKLGKLHCCVPNINQMADQIKKKCREHEKTQKKLDQKNKQI